MHFAPRRPRPNPHRGQPAQTPRFRPLNAEATGRGDREPPQLPDTSAPGPAVAQHRPRTRPANATAYPCTPTMPPQRVAEFDTRCGSRGIPPPKLSSQTVRRCAAPDELASTAGSRFVLGVRRLRPRSYRSCRALVGAYFHLAQEIVGSL